MGDLYHTWVYLKANPLFFLTLTLAAFVLASRLHARIGFNPLLNPVLWSIAMIAGFLYTTDTGYDTYFEGAQFVHFLLGPATVALGIPLYRQFERVRKSAVAILASVLAGSLTAATSALLLGWLLEGQRESLLSLAPKSVTTPVAMGITEKMGGLPSLTAVLVILTGILGAMVGPALLSCLGVKDPTARGLAMGTASHGIGTARALQEGELSGAFSGLAMGLNAIATTLLLPLLWRVFF